MVSMCIFYFWELESRLVSTVDLQVCSSIAGWKNPYRPSSQPRWGLCSHLPEAGVGADALGGGTWLPIDFAPAQLLTDPTVVPDDGIWHSIFPQQCSLNQLSGNVVLLPLAAGWSEENIFKNPNNKLVLNDFQCPPQLFSVPSPEWMMFVPTLAQLFLSSAVMGWLNHLQLHLNA